MIETPVIEEFEFEPLPIFSELVDLFFTKTSSLPQAVIDFLIGRGVPPLALCGDGDDGGIALGCADVILDNANGFELAGGHDEGATRAIVVVARNEFGEPRDLVAWQPRADRVASLYGHVAMLGEHAVEAYRAGDPLPVHRSVLSWLRAGRDGVVVLDRARAGRILRDAIVDLAAEDDNHAREIAALLTDTVDLSRIVVPRAAIRRTA